jgi:FMN reductase
MKQQLRVVGLGGSMREGSSSLAALAIALEGAADAGARTELLNVRSLDLPMYTPAEATVTESVSLMCEDIYAAHGLIWASPMYHGTVSGSFKNALDWLQLLVDRDPPFLTDKVIGLVSTAGGVQGIQAVNTMEFAVRALRGWAVPLVIPIPQAWQAFDEHERPRDPRVEEQLKTLGREVTRVAERMAQGQAADPASECAEAAARAAQVAAA